MVEWKEKGDGIVVTTETTLLFTHIYLRSSAHQGLTKYVVISHAPPMRR